MNHDDDDAVRRNARVIIIHVIIQRSDHLQYDQQSVCICVIPRTLLLFYGTRRHLAGMVHFDAQRAASRIFSCYFASISGSGCSVARLQLTGCIGQLRRERMAFMSDDSNIRWDVDSEEVADIIDRHLEKSAKDARPTSPRGI